MDKQIFTVNDGGADRKVSGDPNEMHLWDLLPVLAGREPSQSQGTVIVNGKSYTGNDLSRTFTDLGITPDSNIQVQST